MPTRARSVLILALLIVVSGMGLSACSSSHEMDLADESMLPDFAQSAPGSVQEAYLFAIAHPEDLSHQPCYWSCSALCRWEFIIL